jgi:hypothetical protein
VAEPGEKRSCRSNNQIDPGQFELEFDRSRTVQSRFRDLESVYKVVCTSDFQLSESEVVHHLVDREVQVRHQILFPAVDS